MLFSKMKMKAEEPQEPKFQDRVAKGIAGFLLSVQNGFASFMNRAVNNLNRRSKQVCLAVFCLMFGGFSMYALFGAFRDSGNARSVIHSGAVAVPKYYDQTDAEFKESPVSEKDIMRINRFKRYMNSLSQSDKGKPQFDSLLKARPGLIDSIKLIEEIYYSQSK